MTGRRVIFSAEADLGVGFCGVGRGVCAGAAEVRARAIRAGVSKAEEAKGLKWGLSSDEAFVLGW